MSKKVIFLIVIILLAIIIAGFFAYRYYFSSSTGDVVINDNDRVLPWQKQDVPTKVNEGDYKAGLKQAISSLMADPNNRQALINTREKILALSVPGDYRQLHLAVVIAINNLEKDPAAISELAEIIRNNDWLK